MTHESSESLKELVLEVRSDDESLRVDTSYWYILKVTDGQAHIEAKTPYGALYVHALKFIFPGFSSYKLLPVLAFRHQRRDGGT